jgi:PAS domain S-box-containing protein
LNALAVFVKAGYLLNLITNFGLMSCKIKILHVNSTPGDAVIVSDALGGKGMDFEIQTTDSRFWHVAILHALVPDVIISGCPSHEFDAGEILNNLRNDGFNTALILLTDPPHENCAVGLMKQGADDYLLRDNLARLPWSIINAVERRRLESALQQSEYLTAAPEEQVNMTNRNLAEQSLRESEANLSAIIENTSDLVYSLDNELRFITFNKLFKDTMKVVYDFDVKQGDYSLDLLATLDPAVAAKWKDNYAKALAGETLQFVNEYDFNDTKVYLSYSINPIRETGKVIGLSCFSRDITRQKLDEEALKKSEASLRTIFNNTDMAYILFDADRAIVSFNGLAQVFSEEENGKSLMEGKQVTEYFTTERRPAVLEFLEKAKSGETVTYEINLQNTGESKWFEVSWVGIKNTEAENLGYLLTNRDITEKKKSEIEREKITADLIKRNKDLEQFTYIISHNLRSPLTNILGLSSLLNELAPNDVDCMELIKGITISANRLDGVISDLNQILQVSHLNEKNETVSLPGLMADIKQSIYYLFEKENVSMLYNFEAVNSMFTLKSYLHSIFYNLILNSIKYRLPGVAPLITITSSIADCKIRITYKDNGRGIDTEKNKKDLFGLYKRFDTSVEGKGMGLFMIKMQVESLGGNIRLRSQLNKGVKFDLEFPATAAPKNVPQN